MDVTNDTPLTNQFHSTPPGEDGTFLAMLPLKNVVMLPKSIIPVIVGRTSSIQAVEFALKHDKIIFITTQKDAEVEAPTQDDIYQYGTRSTILQVMRMPNGALKILAEGLCRARVMRHSQEHDFLSGWCQDLPTPADTPVNQTELEALGRQLMQLFGKYEQFSEKNTTDIATLLKTTDDLDYIADTVATHINNMSFQERQEILQTVDLKERILKLCSILTREIEILETEQRIRNRIQNQVEKNQREYYLTEQMKAIHKELGREDQSAEISQLRAKAKSCSMSEEAFDKVDKELKRLEQMPPFSAESTVSRHYIDWLMALPWKKVSKDAISLAQAETILNKNHAGLNKAKERIIEFLAAKKFSKSLERSPIICLVGPPGVGKTSLAQSIADSLDREFVRISLGGIKDEAEIRGHRRTYIGALPGKIVQAMRKAKTMNPVILLDEIDKMSRDSHGDPAAALLEVLDPEQNKAFVDHFLDVEYDLSKVMFIATANLMDGIPYPLLDRMELISLSGYTEQEKLHICRNFLVPKNLAEYSLTAKHCSVSDDILNFIIMYYTKEAGVRQLDRTIAKIMRKVIQIHLKDKKAGCVEVTQERIKEWLGNQKFKKTNLAEGEQRIGLATGLAWTEVGGDMLEIETSIIPGKGNTTLTGQLGEVMQESAQAALSYIRAHAHSLGLAPSFYTTKDIHVHIPEGATPKDGPSAGITMCTALISALTKTPTVPHLAMTGEITLQGRVLSVGGLKEKLLAAKQHDMKKVIVPEENRDDLEETLKEIDLTGVQLVYAKTMDDVLKEAFTKKPQAPKTKSTKRATKKESN